MSITSPTRSIIAAVIDGLREEVGSGQISSISRSLFKGHRMIRVRLADGRDCIGAVSNFA